MAYNGYDYNNYLGYLTNYNRMQNLFGQPQTLGYQDPSQILSLPNVTTQPITPQQIPPPKPNARLEDLYKPETGMESQYTNYLGQMPQRSHPSLLRRIAASALGAASGAPPQEIDAAMYPGFRDKYADWTTNVRNYQTAADNERADNTNRRLLAQQQLLADRENTRLEQGQQKIDEQKRKDEALAEARNKRIELQTLIANRPEFHPFAEHGGTIKLYDEKTGKVIDTGVDSGTLTDTQKLEMGLSNSLKEIQARTAGAISVKKTASGTPRFQIVQPVDAQNNPTGPAKRVNVDTGEEFPLTDIIKGVTPKAGVGGTETESTTTTTEPPGFLGGLFGFKPTVKSTKQTTTTKTPTATGPPNRVLPPVAPKPVNAVPIGGTSPNVGRVRVKGPNNQSGTVSAEDAKHLPQGWFVVGPAGQ